MTISVSPQIRVVALMGVLLIVLAGAYKFVLHRSSVPPTPVSTPVHTTPAPTTRSQTHGHKRSLSPTTAAAAASAATSAAARVRLNPVNPLLPTPVRWALAEHKVVVVSLWDPQAPVDYISVAEAHAGAADAGVGFVVVNVLDNKVAGPLTALLPAGEMLPDPGLLVYRAPGKIVYRFDGFLDRSSVEQAAVDAKARLDTAPTSEATLP